MKRTNLFLTSNQLARLHERSGLTGLSASKLIRRAIDAYLDAQVVPGVVGKPVPSPPRSRLGHPASPAREVLDALVVNEEGPLDYDPDE